MNFIRPEASQALTRWRAVIISTLIILLGLWWALSSATPISWIGGAVVLMGVASAAAALQRMRFHAGRDGPGVVQIDEGAIAYFGPLTGGVVSRSEVTALAIDRSGKPPHWVLSQPGQPDVMIPLNAAGSDGLFDVFASLPGIRTERMLNEMRATAVGRVLIWQRNTRPATQLLH
ncbi:hypothetical protein [Roseovarius pelagicus]|uniref:Uncharacterized protein n=1 Tax=Roseovarius pelagicus TaxID=2980108 RepID=A0ABY6D9H4_9RHOB|nr:hypothetical protein [Roseovarius pelagicus]UXX82245.1 hypothetical protein N7U68_14195 [Roseovarius pelagicus]